MLTYFYKYDNYENRKTETVENIYNFDKFVSIPWN